MKRIVPVMIGLLLFSVDAVSQEDVLVGADSVRLSLLTCAPGKEVYALFGHTAIRYECPEKHMDWIFNYGVFDFDTPNFIWRFVKGETDYLLGVASYGHFVEEYRYYNRSVWQQTLNLTAEEKGKLTKFLMKNARPENRRYRYNFLYDNCATRPRDKIEECLDGSIHYISSDKGRTFRDIIHEFAAGNEWACFGMDFCLGQETDKLIDDRQKMFAPLYLMAYMASAVVTDTVKEQRLLAGDTCTLVEEVEEKDGAVFAGFPFTPFQTFSILLFVVALITAFEWKKRRLLWWVDLTLFAFYGVSGCMIAFLIFFSEHPAVSPNYLIVVFHPLHILCLPWVIRREIKKKRNPYHLLNFIVLTLFILLWGIIPQRIHLAVLPLSLCLWLRSTTNLILTYKKTG
ncbi:hypothetical protein EZS27_006571 [termite gut metagenome]|uniref:Uncharacterized protein n=1 Tax=termite gut metagenome TaxID=433724 RepID=A0A5J4SKH7_9ZZZZ